MLVLSECEIKAGTRGFKGQCSRGWRCTTRWSKAWGGGPILSGLEKTHGRWRLVAGEKVLGSVQRPALYACLGDPNV